MFIAIFNYIEHLFGKIKPKQLFFMAIDGVAPRAKMNQQRARRFRTAYDAEKAREQAIKEGAEMPKESAFDSNCITPGTDFMARLTQQLRYFINKKVSEDADWQNVDIVLSGHEVPGEGEHKIMEYIRQSKSQPDYNANVRHCLYGLDADLIMLGLLSHDPHFCLLREEVTFGRVSKQQKTKELEHQNFYLLHLCAVREYLELEFQDLHKTGALKFPFDMERVIDDFILMAFFVGNDFLPNLPHLHINEGALALMFDTYKSVLPKTDGYINDGGYIDLNRLRILLDELSEVEHRFFQSEHADASWLKSKQKQPSEEERPENKNKGQLVISSTQKEIFKDIKKWVNASSSFSQKSPYDLPWTLPARDREFVKNLVASLHLDWKTVEGSNGERHLRIWFPAPLEDDENDGEDDEAQTAIFRVLKRYDNAKIIDVSPEEAQVKMEQKYNDKFWNWKDRYYKEKLDWGMDEEEEMRKMAENYVQGLQWVLFYYYRGVASWPWFYGYHYSPMISDVKKGLGADMNFQLGQPFRPFQQLMGVLPDRSKTIVPTAYHDLMTNPDSPIYDFYPRDFDLDMNGKKMEWEAVVKIPFIDETRLLAAMKTKEHLLSEDERQRNDFGVTVKFTYSPEVNYTFPSSLPGIFNDLPDCRCVENIYELPTMDGLEVFVGLVDGVKLGKASLAGFPSLKTLPFAGSLAFHGVSVFQQETRNQSMVLTLLDAESRTKVEQAKRKLGQVVHVGYPFLKEAKVTKVSDELFDYVLPNHLNSQVIQLHHSQNDISGWNKKAERVEEVYSKRLGIIIGDVESMIHVDMLKGLKKTDQGDMVKEYGEVPGMETEYAAQTIVDRVISEDERFIEKAALPIEEEFPPGTRAFFLGEIAYGRPLEVCGLPGNDKVDIWVGMVKSREENWAKAIARSAEQTTPYTPSFQVAKTLHLNPLALSKITSSFSVMSSSMKLNLGLNLKFEARKMKVLGYSRRGQTGWEFSQKAINLLIEYMVKFPEFIAGIQRNPKGDMFNDTDFYPASVAADKMKEIGQWLKSIESKNFERVPLDADQLDSDVCKQIEATAEQVMSSGPKMENKRIKAAPRHALLKPADAEQRLGVQTFTVGDRLVYVQSSGKVPLGLTGTVVGLTRTTRVTLLDVIFDTTFMAGTTLGERCSAFKGASVPSSSVLNLTNRQVVADTRASAARQAPQQPQPFYVNGGHGSVSGQPQLRQAQPPAPLQNSFRNAASAAQPAVGGRGRGGFGPAARGDLNGAPNSQPNQTPQYSFQQQQAQLHQQNLPIRGSFQQQRGRGNINTTGFQPQAPSQPQPAHPGLGYAAQLTPPPNQLASANFANRAPSHQQSQAPNRGGFTVVDKSGPHGGVMQHNPNFRKHNYSSVGPPPSLNPRGGRGGRGGPRSRGDVGRGRGRGRGGFVGASQGNDQGSGAGSDEVAIGEEAASNWGNAGGQGVQWGTNEAW